MARSLACAGARPGDVIHNAYGYGLFTGGLGAHYGGERLGATVVPVSGGMTERQVALIKDFGARVLCATPSYALNIAEVAEREGVDLQVRLARDRRVRRRALERGDAPRARVAPRASARSTSTASRRSWARASRCECEAQDGLHGWEDHFLFEVIDPRERQGAARGRDGRARDHHAHQGGAADDPLPHARHHAPLAQRPAAAAAAMCASSASPAATTTC